MMRVLHITNAYPYCDVPEYGIFVKEQVESLKQSGVSCDVYFINGRKFGKSAYVRAISDIRSRAPEYDLLHCHHLYSSFVTSLALTGKPSVLSFQNDWMHEMDLVNSEILKAIGCHIGVYSANRVIFKSPIPEKFLNNPRVLHLPNGVNAQQFKITSKDHARQKLGLSLSAKYVLFVSSKDKNRAQKRYDRFSEVVSMLRIMHPEFELRELILVNQPRELVPDFFNAADAHLLTSDYEGSPNSVKESLCCGTPVVSTSVGNVSDMLRDLPYCFVSPSFCAVDIVSLVSAAICSEVDREELRRKFLSKGLNQQHVADRLSDLYRGLLADTGR